jgi:hypothetical protein
MRSRNIELKSDLANLFKDLEEAKRESPNVVPISKPKIDQSDIKNLFSGLEEASKQARVVEKKRKDYVETTPTDISNLLKELEEASKQAKNEEPRIPRKKGQPAGSDKHSDLYTDENPKGTIHGLKFATVKDAKASVKKIDNSGKTHAHKVQAAVAMEQRAKEMGKTAEASVYRSYIEKMKKITKEKSKKEETIKLEALESVLTELVDNTAKDIEEEVELVNKLDDNPKPIEVKEEVNFVNDAITHLDDKKKKVDIKEEITDITTLRKEFDNFRSFVGQQLASSQMSGAGSGEVRLEFLDDVQRTTAKVDGKFLKYSSSAGQFIGADSVSDETLQDIVGNMVSSNTESGITVTYQDADGTLDFTIGTLNQDTTGNAATATALETGRTINGTSFDGTANITVTSSAGTLTGNTLNSGVTASSLTSVGTLTSLTVDNVSMNGATIGHTDDTDLITLSDGAVTIAGNLTVSGTTTTVNQTIVNVTDAFVFEGANADAHETTFRVDEPTADRKASLQDKTGTIALLSGFKLNATDGSASNDGDFLVLNTSADENDRLLFEDGTTDPLSVLASHGITLVGQGWNAFQFDNT